MLAESLVDFLPIFQNCCFSEIAPMLILSSNSLELSIINSDHNLIIVDHEDIDLEVLG